MFIDGFVPPSTNVAPMFPCYENTTEWDDFGEVINPDDYVIKDEDMDHPAMHVSSHFQAALVFDNIVIRFSWSIHGLCNGSFLAYCEGTGLLDIFIYLLFFSFINYSFLPFNSSSLEKNSLLILLFSCQVGGDMDGKIDEAAASLLFDTKPSKVISDERTVSCSICSLSRISISTNFKAVINI